MYSDIHYKLALAFIPELGDVLIKNLVSYCGSAEAIFKTSKSKLIKVPGIGEKTATQIIHFRNQALNDAEKELNFVNKHKIQILFYTDKNYPQRLLHCYDAPYLLFYLGTADLNHPKIVSIVGTRQATDYGKRVCENIIEALQPYQVLIVSGLAYGIDSCAHRKSLELKLPTVAVLGHGLDMLYPSQHKNIARQMLTQGGLLTDFTSKTPFIPANFPRRNRIVAGICDALIVVETKIKGGSVITAEIANSYNKDVFAIPGNIDRPYSHGCNYLIRTNKAILLEDVTQLPVILGWNNLKPHRPGGMQKPELLLDLTETEKKIFTMICENGMLTIDEIVVKAGLPSSDVASCLLTLEFKGAIKSLPGKIYEACG